MYLAGRSLRVPCRGSGLPLPSISDHGAGSESHEPERRTSVSTPNIWTLRECVAPLSRLQMGAATARSRNHAASPGRKLRSGTFNGAATARSRNRFLAAAIVFVHVPSMGPRPRGRGIGVQGNVLEVHEFPSMGPRPRGRGISSSCILLNSQ